MNSLKSILDKFSNNLSEEKLSEWLDQFKEPEKNVVLKLLENYLYLDSEKLMEYLKSLHNELLRDMTGSDKILYCPIGFIAKSGSALAYFYRTQNQIDIDSFIDAENFAPNVLYDIEKLLLSKGNKFVFFDDFIGSGNQASDFWTSYLSNFAERHPELTFYLLSVVGTEEGISKVEQVTNFKVISTIKISNDDLLFSGNSKIFKDEEEKEFARKVCKDYGEKLIKEHPFGYGKGELLLSFFYSTPNNTLPIFWATEGSWLPLFPRADSYRGPHKERMTRPTAVQKSRVLRSEIMDIDLTHKTVSLISEEFGSLKYLLKFVSLGFEEKIIQDLITLIRSLKLNTHEKKHVNSLIAFGELNSSNEINLKNILQIKEEINIKDVNKIIDLSGLFDAKDVIFQFNEEGDLIGIFNFQINTNYIKEKFIPSNYSKYSFMSRENPSTKFFFSNGNGGIQIFSKGERILWCKGQSWHSFTISDLIESLKDFRRETSIPETPLLALTDLAIELSDKKEGSTLIIGDETELLKASNIPISKYVSFNPFDLERSNFPILYSLAKYEGAMIFSNEGILKAATAIIAPKFEVKWDSEPARGSRHESAAKMSASFSCLTIVISSDDSRISFYKNGKRQFYIYG